ncbi:unnamed protein product [Bursaphelenchus xylophilus]|uniref:(pine wood nematode) hypothetical protein n=1 Tax=Bursaphelenchus xylophilus TaxID=6326 RepID=A0A1I7S5I3_BURXY|nr:unnamed protein product [Bursaphelenchus xylophilus]CAG9124739.1 unnamed protein product [Bursaphelenchus xylophilus]
MAYTLLTNGQKLAPRKVLTLILFSLLFATIVFVQVFQFKDPHLILREEVPLKFYEKSREWLVMVDPDCIANIGSNKSCKGPVKVMSSRYVDNPNFEMLYFVMDKATNDHLKLYGMLTNQLNITQARAIPRFATQSVYVNIANMTPIVVDIPANLDKFWFHWKKSHFIKCRNLEMKRNSTSRLIPLDKVKILSKYREFADKWNTTFQLACGTLLGWYRECDIISHTQDIDLTGPSSLIEPAFMKAIQDKYKMRYVFGYDKDSLELNWLYQGIRTDLFFKYPHNATHEKTCAVDFGGRKQVFSYYPKVTKTCAGDLHGVLVYVPCNVEEILVSEYGNYTKDIQLPNFRYYADPRNIEAGPQLPKAEFDKLTRYKWP